MPWQRRWDDKCIITGIWEYYLFSLSASSLSCTSSSRFHFTLPKDLAAFRIQFHLIISKDNYYEMHKNKHTKYISVDTNACIVMDAFSHLPVGRELSPKSKCRKHFVTVDMWIRRSVILSDTAFVAICRPLIVFLLKTLLHTCHSLGWSGLQPRWRTDIRCCPLGWYNAETTAPWGCHWTLWNRCQPGETHIHIVIR